MADSDVRATRRWYALRSKPRQEVLASTLLHQAGIEVYIPQERVYKHNAKHPSLAPFFPGYLFGRLDPMLAEIRLATYTPGILYVVGYGGEPSPVPDELVYLIRQRLERQQGWVPADTFKSGDHLVISTGPLRGFDAIFDRHLSGSGRVRVLVQILKRLCPAELHIRHIRRVSKAAGVASN